MGISMYFQYVPQVMKKQLKCLFSGKLLQHPFFFLGGGPVSKVQKRRCKCCRGFITIIVPHLYTVFLLHEHITSDLWTFKNWEIFQRQHVRQEIWMFTHHFLGKLILDTLYKIDWRYLLKCVLWD